MGTQLIFSRGVIALAGSGFDPLTSGLWAQHASTAPPCSYEYKHLTFLEKLGNLKAICNIFLLVHESNACSNDNDLKILKLALGGDRTLDLRIYSSTVYKYDALTNSATRASDEIHIIFV